MNRGYRIFREINSSFLVFKEKNPGHMPTEAFCIFSGDNAEAFCSIVGEATGIDPVLLDAERVIAHGQAPGADLKTIRRFAAALGAAARNL